MTIALLVLIVIELAWLILRDFLTAGRTLRYYVTTTLRRRR